MKLIYIIMLIFSIHGFTQDQPVDLETHEYSLLTSGEIKLKDKTFLYLELGLRGRNTEISRDEYSHELKKYLSASLTPSLLAGASVVLTDPSKDKLRHFSAGYVAGNLTTGTLHMILPKTQKNRGLYSFLAGVGASVVIGVGKEYWDSLGNGQVEIKDALATISGGVTGSLSINLYDLQTFKTKKKFRPLQLHQ